MVDRLTSADFAPLIGEHFEFEAPGEMPFEAVLSDCQQSVATVPAGQRAPFSLMFHAPPERLVAQQICAVRHRALGELELFIVPLGPDQRGMRYEIVFG